MGTKLIDKTASWQNASWWHDKLSNCHIDEFASWQNNKLTKWQVGEMANWKKCKLMKQQVCKILVDEMVSYQIVPSMKWHVDKMLSR